MHAEGSGEHLLTADTILASTKKVQKKTNNEIKLIFLWNINECELYTDTWVCF